MIGPMEVLCRSQDLSIERKSFSPSNFIRHVLYRRIHCSWNPYLGKHRDERYVLYLCWAESVVNALISCVWKNTCLDSLLCSVIQFRASKKLMFKSELRSPLPRSKCAPSQMLCLGANCFFPIKIMKSRSFLLFLGFPTWLLSLIHSSQTYTFTVYFSLTYLLKYSSVCK